MKKFEYFEKLLFDKIQKKRTQSHVQDIKDGNLHVGDFAEMFREARQETSEHFKPVCENCDTIVADKNEMFCSNCNDPVNWEYWSDGDKTRYNKYGNPDWQFSSFKEMTDDTRKINPSPCKGEIPSRYLECMVRNHCVRYIAYKNGDPHKISNRLCRDYRYRTELIEALEIKPITKPILWHTPKFEIQTMRIL